MLTPAPPYLRTPGEACTQMQRLQPEKLLVSPVLVKYMSSSPSRLQQIFWTVTTTTTSDNVVHRSWYWCFRAIIRTGNKLRTVPIRDSVYVLIDPRLATKYAEFLQPATYVPSWDRAQGMGGGSSALLGNLGHFTEVYPVEAEHVIALYNELINPTM